MEQKIDNNKDYMLKLLEKPLGCKKFVYQYLKTKLALREDLTEEE